jgi:MFS transporter, ACS family, hexuronate transporter
MAFLLALVNYIDRGAMSYAASHVTEEYGFDRGAWGSVLGYFGYGYMIGALFGGILSDRFGPRKIWISAGIAWSVFEFSTAWAGDFGLAFLGGSALAGFAMIRILFGGAEGPAYANLNKTVANWAVAKERGFVVGFGLISTPLGALLTAPVAVGLLTLTGSWRAMFYVLGCAGLIVLALFARIFTDRPDDNPRVSKLELAEIRASRAPASGGNGDAPALPWWSFFRSRTLLFNTLGYFSFMYVNFLLLTWTPKYLQDNFGYSLSSLWYMGMIPWVGACFTVLLGGKISDWLFKRTGKLVVARSRLAAACLLATTLSFLTVSQATSVAAVIALMTLANAFNSLANSVYWAVVIDTAPAGRVGAFSGLMLFFANIASILAPTLTGYLTASHGYPAMFVAASIATAVGMIAMLQVRPGVFLR